MTYRSGGLGFPVAKIEPGVGPPAAEHVAPSGRCSRRQTSFDACDQLWNADRLGQKWMSLDP